MFDRPELAALSDTRKGAALLSWVYWRRPFLAIFYPELPPGTRQARDLLLRHPTTLTADERDAVHRFFRERITETRDAQATASWEAQLAQVFDYTAWHASSSPSSRPSHAV